MNRITEIEIAGKKYPLNFSTKAAREISARYGGLENMDKVFAGKPVDGMIEEVVWLLSLLIEQGVAYRRIVEEKDANTISTEDLEVVLGVSELTGLKDEILGAMLNGMKQTVEVEADPKNGETTQGD